MTLIFGPDDPARVRFAVSPLWETMNALRLVLEPQRRKYHLPWLDAVRSDMEQLDLWPLLVLSPVRGWTPDFLSPTPTGPGTDVGEQLAQVRATPESQVAYEVRRALTQRADAVPDRAWQLLDDPAATRAQLADVLEQAWQLLIAPHWLRLRDLLRSDVVYRTQLLADYGLERVLEDLHSSVRWTGRAMEIDWPEDELYRLGGAGLLLTPSVFIWPSVAAVTDPPASPSLVYPARGIAELWQPAQTRRSDALARLLGKTRAALLESLAEPASTHTLARRHGLAPSTVSEHLTTLRESGLVVSRRHRHTLMYQQSQLGASLAGD